MPQTSLQLLYGRGTIGITMPESAQAYVIQKPAFPQAASAEVVFQAAMNSPIGSQPLDVLCQGCESACILICDITRPVPNHVFLRPMIETMMAAGIVAEKHNGVDSNGASPPERG